MIPYYDNSGTTLYCGDCRAILAILPDESVDCCITSPPYFGLRDYGCDQQIGLEPTPLAYTDALVAVFREVWRVLKPDGTLWLNLGDSYANDGKWGGHTGGKHAAALHCTPVGRNKRYTGLKPKDLIGIPWRVAFALQADGWYLRSDIIWAKPNPMPESVKDRPTRSHEYVFLLSKSKSYYYNADAIAEACRYPEGSWGRSKCYDGDKTGKLRSFYGDGRRWKGGEKRNSRDVWTIATQPFRGAHFAVFPQELARRCILAGCPSEGIVLDPFSGAGTAAVVARENGRKFVGIDLNPSYCDIAIKRLALPDPSAAPEAPVYLDPPQSIPQEST